MPYIIYVPAMPRPYITNDPRIYVDCSQVFGWICESRPFSDSYCKNSNTGLPNWDGGRLKQEAEAALMESLGDVEEPAPIEHPASTDLVNMSRKHNKRDSVLSVFLEIQESVAVAIVKDIGLDSGVVPAPWISLAHLADQHEFSLEMAWGAGGNHSLV
ncbi:Nn.00g113760.m01.CDS01 [Neocucurbitaria sp. VM-36]